ncbi:MULTISPECIES: N-acetylmuramoyl-L-alanine amidase-like domain-containing protein [Planktothricoides]|uniref:N-acetylmuramoyl-L-alanine amidase-like domain-containing protein n=1 Tax=Planktothricoides raciborskii GIHE-MW2 TaxID=2792601 RepID=A0AAU8JJ94_9CYAN|nr:N-acetylmuramoyl-L-alanine amidase-like domain-containing protein [Planktothricoides sp. SR001]
MDFNFQKNCLYLLSILSLILMVLAGIQATAYYQEPDLSQGQTKKAIDNPEELIPEENLLTDRPLPELPQQLPQNQDKFDSLSPVVPPEILPSPGENRPQALSIYQGLDSEMMRFNQVMQYAIDAKLSDRPLGEIIQAIGEQFLGTPYMAGLLDKSPEENLVVTLQGFDCVLFVETVLAIARGIAQQDYNYQNFRDRVQEQRYRGGKIDGYCSRLHYFSDWIYDNQNRRLVENITQNIGGIPLGATLNFMTQHRQYYPQLANESNYQCILNQEARLAHLNIRYIPQDKIATIYPYLQPGDIIATATDIPGLDVTHTGLVYRFPDGGIGFIHASPSGEVKISRDLQSYIQAVDGQIGIIVARPYY